MEKLFTDNLHIIISRDNTAFYFLYREYISFTAISVIKHLLITKNTHSAFYSQCTLVCSSKMYLTDVQIYIIDLKQNSNDIL